jgi:hypothetical protein
MGTYWRWMGEAMEIPFNMFKGHSKRGWTDGLHFLGDVGEWSLTYEVENMVPSEANEKVAKYTVDLALFNIPKAALGISFDFISGLLEPRLRRAMKSKDPSQLTACALDTLVAIRRLVLRHLFLPRPYFMRKRWCCDKANDHGLLNFKQYLAHPWYIKPTFFNRWNFNAMLIRLTGGVLPGDEGTTYHPEGHKLSELGPEGMRGKGKPEMAAMRQHLIHNERVGYPFGQ